LSDREEIEHVPWSELMEEPDDSRRRRAYLAAGLLGAVAFGVIVARAWWSPAITNPPQAPSTSIVEEAALPEGDAAVPSTSLPPLYSEADLMAFPPDPGARVAVARAEWFVTDYFTADFEPSGSADVRSALPAGVDLPALPQDGTKGISYVEWAKAFRVDEAGDGKYRVGVLFRALGAPPETGFNRQPVRAVDVTVAVSPDGGTTIVDLPTPTALPLGPEPDPWPENGEEAPPGVLDQALQVAAAWGSEPRLVGSQRSGAGWRVVLTVTDSVGNRWPLSIAVDVE